MAMTATDLVWAFLLLSSTAAVNESFFLVTVSTPNSYEGSIIRLHAETLDNDVLSFSSRLYNPVAMDFDPVEDMIYWSEVGVFNRIRKSSLHGGLVTTVLNDSVSSVIDGLAVDPINRLLFYSDTGRNVIGKMSISEFDPEIIINSDLDEPRAIALHTEYKMLFWTDWGDEPKIERANYDGDNRTTLVRTGLKFVNGLALDVDKGLLYWVDAGTDAVEVCDLEGKNRRFIPSVPQENHFFAVALCRDALYITDWAANDGYSSRLIRVELNGTGDAAIIGVMRYGRMNGISCLY